MATTYYNDIQKLYVAYFNRPADPAGLAYWETVVEGAKGSTAAVSASFAASAEYKAAYANMTNTQVVTAVYQNLFGHAPDAAGLKYWADLLDAKTTTIDAVVTNIAGGAQSTDLIAYTAKVTAASAFTAAIDTDAEKAGYTGDAANKIGKTFLAGVTDSASLASATSPATLNGTVANAVAAGTTFSVAGALAQVSAATKAVSTFIASTPDSNKDGTTDATDIAFAKTTAISTVAADLAGGATGTSGALFTSTDSQTVRDALISAQQTTNADNLRKAQAAVVTDNANIAKVTGLADAVAALATANSVVKSAQTADLNAQADLAAKEASFQVNNGGTLSVTGSAVTFTASASGSTPVTLATIAANGQATVTATSATFDPTDYDGLTDLITSINADATTSATLTRAQTNAANAQLAANLLEIAPATDAQGNAITIAVGNTNYTEANLVKAIVATINTATPNTLDANAVPTVQQIQATQLKLTGQALTDFNALVTAETNAKDAKYNPLVGQQATDTALVTSTTNAISKLAKDVAALQTANANADTLAGLNASVTAYNKVLTDKGYAVTTLDAAHTATTIFGTAASDIYVASNKDATITAFGLQGSDSMFVGTGYTLVQGSIKTATNTTGVAGNNSAMEIFVSKTAGGDAQLQIETHAYSSSVVGGTGEIVTITLTGVDASTIKLDSTGIITAGTTAA